METYTDYLLTAHNTFHIAARCRRFIAYSSATELSQVLQDLNAEAPLPWLHIGEGSNLLFTHDYPGTVLHSKILGVEEVERYGDEVVLRVGAGENWDRLVAFCVERGYHGLENLSLIPGEVGASAVQNIGAYGSEAGQFIRQVEGIDAATGQPRVLQHDDCRYAYRDSVFKHELRGRFVVTHVCYKLSLRFQPNLSYGALQREMAARRLEAHRLTPQALREFVVDIRRAKLPDPAELGSAGSFFMNPVVDRSVCERLLADYPDMPHYEAPNGYKIPAAWLIEHSGWKGRRLGPAGVYDRQALVLVNYGGATGADIVRLSQAVSADVLGKFGISLQPEVNFI